MINRHYISLLWATILLMVASLTACSSNDILGDIEEGSGDTNTFRLSFDIVLPVIPGSRADSPWEEGWGTYENSINLVGKDYRILLFSTEKKLLAAFTPDEVVMIENQRPATDPANTTLRSYRLYAEVDKSITANTELKLCVVANWGTYPEMTIGTTTIDDLAGYSVAAGAAADKGTVASSGPTTFAGSSKLTASGGRYIPMFGIRDCKGINWVNFNLSWLGELWLLRSVAKIEVKAAEGSPAIESVTLNHYNKLGTCAPKRVYRQADYTVTDDKDNGEDKYKGSLPLTLPGDKNDPASGSYLLTSPDNNGTFVVYVPEYQVLKDPSKPKGELVADYPRLQVKFKDIERLYDVDFKYYTQDAADPNNATVGDFFDISRNYYYRYTLRLNNVELFPEVIVIPYIETILNPDFGLKPGEPDKYQDFKPVMSRHEDILFYTDGTAKEEYKDATGFLAPDHQTEIDNPLEILSPEGWWTIKGKVQDREVTYFYYDPVEKVQYAPDRKTKVRTVFSFTEVGYLAYLELEADGIKETGVDNYHDAWHDLWYDLPPTKGYYVDKTKTTTGVGYVYDTNSNQVINRFTKKPVEFVSIEKSIKVENGKKYLIDANSTQNSGKVQVTEAEGDVILKIILLESPYPEPQ